MFVFSREDGRPSLLAGTIKTVAAVGLLSWLAGFWLSSAPHDQLTLSRLATNISRGQLDPLTTGTIGTRANAPKIDPCAAPKR